MEFDPWRDYLQLNLVIREMAKSRSIGQPPVASSHLSPALVGATTMANKNDGDPNNPGIQPTSSVALGEFKPPDEMCNFCKHNGESRLVYTSHALKSPGGTVVCPVLRKYVCPLCGATGDSSHTLSYCPLNEEKHSLYRKSGRNSAGRKLRR
ncbi:nanos homolog 2 [Pelobates fuscus]|uniref:nanos homolog 2 n=1 Tax=Pelobates fuscus TaxID=191477 RepID=UPI002FE495BC